jgi:isoleucyl-tRNA synthetase
MSVENLKNVKPNQDFVQMEQNILRIWEEKNILQKYLKKNEKSSKNFSFIDGPITANNPMGVHHAWGRTYKDIVQRYKNLQGFEQRFQNGFDCQGLWVEVQVEKELGFNSKKDILDYGMDKFTNACVARVNKYAKIQTDQSKRLGMFMDWENSYYTMSETNNLYIWKFLQICHEKGLIYKSKSSTTWCPRCETGLSQHEQADAYQTIKDRAVYVLFRLKDSKEEYVLAWTTTPWTLSANVLLAVNPDMEYVKTEMDGKTIYLGREAALRLGIEEFEETDIKKLVGRKYESLLDNETQKDLDHYIVEWDLVDSESGSGVVHIAPGCGQEDFELGEQLGVPSPSPLSTSGHFTEGYAQLTGKYAHDVADEVIELLEQKGSLFKTEEYEHTYPHCWRCGTKCLFRLEDNWFIRIDDIRTQLKNEASKVTWIPEFVEKRMQDWLDNMEDWMISRSRFYGLALPFYECKKCNKLHVIGSKEELKEFAVDPSLVDNLTSLHRPWIDEVEIKCPECNEQVKRVTDVGDCWLDAGVVSFSTLKYLEDKKYWEKWYPAEFVVEMIEQVRLWFYSMLVFGVVFEGKAPYESVLGFAEVRDEKNQRMSKTKGNYIPFDEAADKVGTDIIRWNFATSSIGGNMRFSFGILEDVRRRFYIPLWNTYNYFVTYAKLHNWDITKYDPAKVENVMDRWMLSKLAKLTIDCEENMDIYNMARTSRDIEDFVKELSQWYIRRSRNRFRDGDSDALGTLHYVLLKLSKILSPFVPFVSEEIYTNIATNLNIDTVKESVHLEEYPSFSKENIDDKLLENMDMVRDICSSGLKAREIAKLSLRQPLQKAYIAIKDEDMLGIVKEELNVKELEYSKEPVQGDNITTVKEGDHYVSLLTELTEELKKEGIVNDFLRKYRNVRKKKGLKIDDLVSVEIAVSDGEVREALKEYINKNSKDMQASKVDIKQDIGNYDDKFKVSGEELRVKID